MIRFSILATAFVACCMTGCSTRFDASYGASSGMSGRNSLNGFGALRSSFEKADYQVRDVRRLTDRTSKNEVIVWTPTVMRSVDIRVTRWFERWLARGGRTLVYIVPDSGSEAAYWVQAGKSAPPKQRMEYRRRAARKLNERMQWTINRRQTHSNGWFVVKPQSQMFPRDDLQFKGWSLPAQANDDDASTMLTEYVIEPIEQPQPTAGPNTPPTNTPPTNTPPATPAVSVAPTTVTDTGATGPAAPYPAYDENEVTRTEVDFESLVQTKSGQTIVAEITSEKWRDSKIVVVAGGSLLTNFAFTQPTSRHLAAELIATCQADSAAAEASGATADRTDRGRGADEPVAGFLLTSYSKIPVSESKSGIPQASGMEVLTTWPISLVTIHAALLGFVVCIMLLPIFGRPKAIDRGSTSHFRDHLDAVAHLMMSARGEKYARSRISQYMRRMKGESSGPWVIDDKPPSLIDQANDKMRPNDDAKP